MGRDAPGGGSGVCSQPEPVAIWTPEKFLKIALGALETKQKGSHLSQFILHGKACREMATQYLRNIHHLLLLLTSLGSLK